MSEGVVLVIVISFESDDDTNNGIDPKEVRPTIRPIRKDRIPT
jgi:hypothetical protein